VLGFVLAWPAASTVRESVIGGDKRFVGLANYWNALTDPQLRTDLINTGIWAVVVPLLVTAVGYTLAVLSRRIQAGRVFTLVLAPMALSLVVVGVAFRLLYSSSPRLSPATAMLQTVARWMGFAPESVPQLLGPTVVTSTLISAFVWSWVGFAVVLFRAALDDIPQELQDAARAEGAGPWKVLRDVQWPFLRRVSAIIVVLLAVAGSRTFDLVLVMVPGSVQNQSEVLALYILRQPNVQAAGEAAAVGVLWLLVVAVGGMLAARAARHDWPTPHTLVIRQPSLGRRWRRQHSAARSPLPGRVAMVGRGARRVVLGIVITVWAFPVVLLVLISLHAPLDPATRGWLAPLSLESYREMLDTALVLALLPTAILAVTVTTVVLVVAVFAAHSLAWLHPYGRRAATVVLIVTAIVPIQIIAKPLQQLLAPVDLRGTLFLLAAVHIGRGIPVAVLVLRNAFAAVPADRIRRARLRNLNEINVLVRAVVPAAWPALIGIATLEFILVWNDLVVGFLFGGPGFTPVGMVLLGQSRQFVTNVGVLSAGSVAASVLPLLLVLLARRAIVSGLVSGVIRQ
jgi:alpha-glucoside transport system permease protein